MKKRQVKRLCVAAICLALSIALPGLFHLLSRELTSLFSPIHIPVLLCGLACGWYFGAICGALAPAVSYLVLGMIPFAKLPAMITECAVYGLMAGLLICLIKTKRSSVNLYLSLFVAMILGRIVYAMVNFYIFGSGTAPLPWIIESFTIKLPGFLLQLFLVPLLYLALKKAKLITKPSLK